MQREVYGLLKVPELKRELLRRQLNVVGTRRELTERLLEDDQQRETLDIPSGDAVDAVDAVDCEIVEECVDFDLYGGVKGEVLDDPQQQPIDMEQGNQQVPTVPTAEDDATLGQLEKTQEEGRVKRRKRKRRQSKGLQHKEAQPTDAPAVPSAPVLSETQEASEAADAPEAAEVPASQETSEEKGMKFLKDVLKRCCLDERLGCNGYEDLLLQLHEKLLPPYQHPLDTAFEPPDVPPAPEEALEAAWAEKPQDAAESEPDQRDDPDDQEESEKTTGQKPDVEELSPALQEELGRLEAKVQEAMKRTARAQLQLRRKKAEELLLVGPRN